MEGDDMEQQEKSHRGLGRVLRGIADGLRPPARLQFRVLWPDDPDAPKEPGPGVIVLKWLDEAED